jgi:heme a synthase
MPFSASGRGAGTAPLCNTQLRRFSFAPNSPVFTAASLKPGSPLGGLADTLARGQQEIRDAAEERKRGFFPETSSRTVGYWLLGSAGLVFGIVVLGGLTRLTESGYVFVPLAAARF